MTSPIPATPVSPSSVSRRSHVASLTLAFAAVAALSACGGGGSPAPAPTATVTSATISSGRFGSSTLVQVSGTHLDDGMTVSSTDCTGLTLLTAAPYVSTATNAFYSCTIASMSGAVAFKQRSSGATITTASYTVASLPQVQFTFSGPVAGSMIVDLAADKEPVTVTNFLHYVNAGLYNGLIIHRVTTSVPLNPLGILQGGGYTPVTDPNKLDLAHHVTTFAPIALEIDSSLHNAPGTLAMARTSQPNSATSEFYFNVQNNSSALDNSYAVFGSLATPGDISYLTAIQGAACVTYLSDGSCLPVPNVVTQTIVQIR
jgi:cyclophilin family peptidyl-prolyl cis-trans isomerase